MAINGLAGVIDQRASLVQLIDGVESAMEYTLRDEMKIDPADIADFDEVGTTVCSTSYSRNRHSECCMLRARSTLAVCM
jgi:hypothetical protein